MPCSSSSSKWDETKHLLNDTETETEKPRTANSFNISFSLYQYQKCLEKLFAGVLVLVVVVDIDIDDLF